MEDVIRGEYFETVADFTFSPVNRHRDDHSKLRNTFEISRLKPISIVYTHSFYVREFFEVIKAISDKQFVLVSHNSDLNIDNSFEIPVNIIRWFSQNVTYSNPRLESVPIGLENNRWFPKLHKTDKMIDKLYEPRTFVNMVYMNHDVKTNVKERVIPYILLENKEWVTAKKGHNGMNFDEYLQDIYSHPFIICPVGNGIDTHRVWEALYMGCIPIVLKNINNSFYSDLPICFVDEWNQITPEFLKLELNRIQNSIFNMEKLKFSYWKNKIREACQA